MKSRKKNVTKTVKQIEKDRLNELNYLRRDVLFNKLEKSRRKKLLEKACRLGTSFDSKASKIIFACKDGIKKVEAKVISLSKDRVILKGRNSIPIKSIISLEMINH